MQVEPESSVRMGLVRQAGAPQRDADPLTCGCPGGWCSRHEVDRAVVRQGNGETGPQQAVGRDSREMPAKQVRGEMSEIGADPPGEQMTLCARHFAQVQVHIDVRCRAGPRPVANSPARGGGFDHRRRHGELAHARPEKKAGILARGQGVRHQHSPVANGTPDLHDEVSIETSVAESSLRSGRLRAAGFRSAATGSRLTITRRVRPGYAYCRHHRCQ